MPPYLKIYDGTTDPEDHLIHYVTIVKGTDMSKEQVPSVLLKRFGETLTGGALTWYSQLRARSISTFEEMAEKFATAHAEAKKAEARVNDIFVVRRDGSSSLSKWVKQERIKGDQKIAQQTHEVPPTTWEEIHNAYCAEVRADEDDLNGPFQRLTSVQTETRRDRRNDGRRDQPPCFNRERHQPYIQIVYALEKLVTKVQWPQKMKSDPSTRRSNVLYEFHQERGHKTEDCIGLRQEVVRMLNQGYLKELLSGKGRANFARGRDPSQGLPKPPSPSANHTNDHWRWR
uniref:Uncharacterized protein LOC104249690 n=1 Tax=Nicotiana sylvestris TaxID=4096 RepID=A0A1U7YK58_NICSY|nr:PREDICTED: uncharacterized protein LOC104249690 [Nicotiana sylvestris]